MNRLLLIFVLISAGTAHAQARVQDDSIAAAQRAADSLTRAGPPLTPAKAFVTSLLVPGLGQSILRRPTAMVVFSTIEVTGWLMLLRSIRDLNRARDFAGDSVAQAYDYDPQTGKVRRDPVTGDPIISAFEPNVFRAGLIDARKKHVEDWAAIVAFNHLLAATDALVAAHLWDLPAQLRIDNSGRVIVAGSIKW